MVGYILGYSFAKAIAEVTNLGKAHYYDTLLQDINNTLAKKYQRLEPKDVSIKKV